MGKMLTAGEQPIAKVFSDDYVFTIPGYQRPYQALGHRTPDAVYASGIGGGASIPDHWKKNVPDLPATEQHGFAATEEVNAA